MAGAVRPLLLAHLPAPLHEKRTNWGRTSSTFSRIRWEGARPHVERVPKNDGTWRRLTVAARDPAKTLEFSLSNLQHISAEKQTFDAQLALLVGVERETVLWENGVRLFGDVVRARLKLKARLACESLLRLEPAAEGLVPDAVFRLRVVKAEVSYDDLVVEHVAGVGGTAAKVLGRALFEAVDEMKPSLERDLLAKANAAVVRAADTREIRISLSRWLQAGK